MRMSSVSKEQLGEINPKVARRWSDYGMEIPFKYIEENRRVFGDLSKISTVNPVKNLRWEWLYFEDCSYFTPAANAFRQSIIECEGTNVKPRYTPHLKGTAKYRDFWREERRRCLEGYEPIIDGVPCGLRLTGEHYFYLNYCRIRIADIDTRTGEETEIEDFPKYLSMDYYWFKELEARENPSKYGLPSDYKKSIILAKSRRLGFSFKNAAGAVWKYSFWSGVKVAIISELGDKGLETFEKCLNIIDWLTEHTEFGGPHIYRTFNKQSMKGSIKAGVKTKSGTEKGRKSVIYTISLHNRPDAASGAGCVRVLFEEAGMISKLDLAWTFAEGTLRSGKIYKGIAIIFGTGGEMVGSDGKSGASRAFSRMFYDPAAYKLAALHNIYEYGDDDTNAGNCGLFYNITWLREGAKFITPEGKSYEAIDKNGNIRAWVGELDLNQERVASLGKDKSVYETELTQYCKTPREAFLIVKGNTFPVAEIEARLDRLLTTDDLRYLSTHGTLVEVDGVVHLKPDVDRKLRPLDRFPKPSNQKDVEGAVVIYEQPRRVNGIIPYGAYVIGVDTIGEDAAGESMIAIYVVKTGKYPLEIGHDEVVACYIGRPSMDPIEMQNSTTYKLAKFYNALVTHENDRTGPEVRTYFIEKNAYEYLLPPPSDIVDTAIANSKTNLRKTGHSMSSPKMKELGEVYLKRWLLQSRGIDPSTGKEFTNLDKIRDIALLQELQNYNREGNYDRVLALMGAIIQIRQLESRDIRSSKKQEDHSDYLALQAKRIFAREQGDNSYVMTDSRLTHLTW
jgi:hypothetical protein